MTRPARLLLAIAALGAAACTDVFLDPQLAGTWGGENLELRFERDRITARLLCDNIGTFPGEVRLDAQGAFHREGIVSGFGTRYAAILDATVTGDSMSVLLYPDDPLVDPGPPVTLHKGRNAVYTALVLCAQD